MQKVKEEKQKYINEVNDNQVLVQFVYHLEGGERLADVHVIEIEPDDEVPVTVGYNVDGQDKFIELRRSGQKNKKIFKIFR